MAIQSEQFELYAAELQSGGHVWKDSYFDHFTAPNGWCLIGDNMDYHVTLVGNGLFAKVFSPACQHFYEQSQAALNLLSKLPLRTPILNLIYSTNRVLFFVEGSDVQKVRVQDIFDVNERIQIRNMLLPLHLTPLGPLEKVDLVTVSGKRHVVDPFDDSFATIDNFLEMRMRS